MKPLPKLGLGATAILFGGAALLMLLATRVVIPVLISASGWEPVVLWFIAASVCLFAPMLMAGAWLLFQERRAGVSSPWQVRLRLQPMSAGDLLWALSGIVVVCLITGGCVAILRALAYDAGLHPSFMAMNSLAPGRYWILAAWLPFFLLNILGEEFVWRSVLLPRQEVAFGKAAWLVNACGWWLMHIAFPWQVLLTLIPTIIVVPAVAQRTQNTWPGVVIHGVLNGVGFLGLAFGMT
jgi:membrane protease YdiL (CAAX protease family)